MVVMHIVWKEVKKELHYASRNVYSLCWLNARLLNVSTIKNLFTTLIMTVYILCHFIIDIAFNMWWKFILTRCFIFDSIYSFTTSYNSTIWYDLTCIYNGSSSHHHYLYHLLLIRSHDIQNIDEDPWYRRTNKDNYPATCHKILFEYLIKLFKWSTIWMLIRRMSYIL